MQSSTVLVGGRLEIGGHRERSGMGGIGIQQAQAEGWFLAGQLLHGLRSGRGRREPFQNLAPQSRGLVALAQSLVCGGRAS